MSDLEKYINDMIVNAKPCALYDLAGIHWQLIELERGYNSRIEELAKSGMELLVGLQERERKLNLIAEALGVPVDHPDLPKACQDLKSTLRQIRLSNRDY